MTRRILSGARAGATVTIPGLTPDSEYEIRVRPLNRETFDLYRAGRSGSRLQLIPLIVPAAKWRNNVSDAGKTRTLTASTPRASPALRIANTTVAEGPNAVAVFTVTLSRAAAGAVTVDYATSNGTAEAASDYTATSGALTIPVGETSGTISVPVIDDRLDEPDETFAVNLANPRNATLEDGEAIGTIEDDDEPPALGIGDATVTEGPNAVAEFAVTLDAASGQTVTVDYATADGTAQAELDYLATNGVLILPAGRRAGVLRVPVIDDELHEPDEAFSMKLFQARNAAIGDDKGTGTIVDNDDPPVSVSWGAASYAVNEGGRVIVDVVLSARPERRVVVPLILLPGEKATTSDYAGVPATVTFGPSDTRTSFTVLALEDEEYEGAESVLLGFGSLPPRVAAADPETATVTIADSYLPHTEADDWMDPFGRTVANHVMKTLDDRLRCAPARGEDVPSPAVNDRGAKRYRCRPPWLHSGSSGVGLSGRLKATVLGAGSFTTDSQVAGIVGAPATFRPAEGHSLRLTAAELLASGAFDGHTRAEGEGRVLGAWGRGSFSRFSRRFGDLQVSGEVGTATLGADYSNGRWMAGAALSQSSGEGTVSRGTLDAAARSELLGLFPYLRLGVSERLSIWAIAGQGQGTLTLTWDDEQSAEYDIALTMGAAGFRGELTSLAESDDGLALALKGDALVLRTSSHHFSERESSLTDATQLRLAVEGSRDYVSPNGNWINPFIEAGLRRDGGDHASGLRAEVGGGLRYGHPGAGVTTEVGARSLIGGEDEDLEEWGIWGSLRYDPRPSSPSGLAVALTPSLGVSNQRGVDALWHGESLGGPASGGASAGPPQVAAELTYGLPFSGRDGVGTPLIGFSASRAANVWRAGYRLTIGSTVDVAAQATVRQRPAGNPTSTLGFSFHGALRW